LSIAAQPEDVPKANSIHLPLLGSGCALQLYCQHNSTTEQTLAGQNTMVMATVFHGSNPMNRNLSRNSSATSTATPEGQSNNTFHIATNEQHQAGRI